MLIIPDKDAIGNIGVYLNDSDSVAPSKAKAKLGTPPARKQSYSDSDDGSYMEINQISINDPNFRKIVKIMKS